MVDNPQVFCDVCHRGVLINKESLFKCVNCGRQVCITCWDGGYKMCSICSKPYRLEEQKVSAEKAKADEEKKIFKLQQEKIEEKAEKAKIRKRRISLFFAVIFSLLAVFLFIKAMVQGDFWWFLFVIDCIISFFLYSP
jgi:hypothetical protein